MNIEEILNSLKTNGITDKVIDNYIDVFKESDPSSFDHPVIKDFIKIVNDLPYNPKVQEAISYIVRYMTGKGVNTPCMSGCSDDCVFHDIEEKNG